MKPITKYKRTKARKLRAGGMSYPQIAETLKISRSSVQKIASKVEVREPEVEGLESKVEPAGPVEARFLKPFPNPRLICIYFGERKDAKMAKCVVKPGKNWQPNARVMVLPVEGDDELYRLA